MTKVLVVDDDAELCKIYERVLKNYGFATITARDGTEALSKFTKKKPDLVMLDCDMPDHSGLEIARDILAQSPTTGVVMITGREGALKEAEHIGVDIFLTKPVSRERLIESVTALSKLRPGMEIDAW